MAQNKKGENIGKAEEKGNVITLTLEGPYESNTGKSNVYFSTST